MCQKGFTVFVRVAPPYGFAIALAILAAAVVLRAGLNPLLGTQFASAPVLIAALVVTWYLGTAPAIMVALLGYPAVRFFVRQEPFGTDFTDDLGGWLTYGVLIALIIGFTRRFRLDRDAVHDASRERQRSEKLLYQQANFDALTGIANRMLFFDRLNTSLEHVTRHGNTLAIMFIDIDGFKDVNDTYGHMAGDQLLAQIAAGLKNTVRAEDTVARLGGDEFAILMPRLDRNRDVTHLASKVLKAIAQPFNVDGGKVTVSASVGVALSSDSGNDSTRLIKCADMAMFRAKKHGKNGFHVFERQMLVERERYHHMQRRLKDALIRNEFVLHYQPKRLFSNEHVSGVEALLRWKSPEDARLIMPNDFIWILEESGLIEPVGAWVLQQACMQIAAWQRQSMAIPVAVNVSVKQIAPKFVKLVSQALEDSAVNGSMLELEITESAVMQRVEDAIHVLGELRAMGVKIAIDDFGTGHSSLSLIKRLPLDVLKIDRSFVAGLPRNEGDASICKAIVQMAHSLKLCVVAEGIEHPWQYDFLKQHDCDEAQGFLIGRPVGAEAIRDQNDLGNVLDLVKLRTGRDRPQEQVHTPPS
jgi:diguanylate cyclase (GGDEF)-like protein